MHGSLNYDAVGATKPAAASWPPTPGTYRRFETEVGLGRGDDCWQRASAAVMVWGVKTRSGFDVAPTSGGSRVRVGDDVLLTARIGPLRVREPVRVVAVVEERDRVGFAYGTCHGHPVAGEEMFVVRRLPDGAVHLTLRSLTRPAGGLWRRAFPAILLAQRVYRRRYLRALAPHRGGGGVIRRRRRRHERRP